MGVAKNLKLGAMGQGPGYRRTTIFLCAGQMLTFIQLLCASKSCSGVQGQSPWLGGQGRNPSEAETLLAFGRTIEATNLPAL